VIKTIIAPSPPREHSAIMTMAKYAIKQVSLRQLVVVGRVNIGVARNVFLQNLDIIA